MDKKFENFDVIFVEKQIMSLTASYMRMFSGELKVSEDMKTSTHNSIKEYCNLVCEWIDAVYSLEE